MTGAVLGGIALTALPELQSSYPLGGRHVLRGDRGLRDPAGEGAERCVRLPVPARPLARAPDRAVDPGQPADASRRLERRARRGAEPSLRSRRGCPFMRTEPLLVVDDVVVQFGGVTAVNHASFVAEAGRVTGLIGPNGAGKTTCFNVISGLQKPTRGKVRFNGRNVSHTPVHRRAKRGMGRTFQRLEAFGSLTVRDNVRVAHDIHAGLLGPGPARARPTSTGCSSGSASRRTPTSGPTRSPPASPGCSSWPGAWPATRSCCCSTSRRPARTSPRPRRSASCCATSRPRAAASSWSSTTWTWSCRSATRSTSSTSAR